MSTLPVLDSKSEYISHLRLLITKTYAESNCNFTDYILFFFSFLREVELHPVENVIIASPGLPEEFSKKLHKWFNSYVLPQLNHLGVGRVAVVSDVKSKARPGQPVFYGIKPEIGLFSSMPEAKAWIMGLMNQPASKGLRQNNCLSPLRRNAV